MKDYIKGLDGLRAVAIAFVVVHHAHYLTSNTAMSSVAKFLGSGVDLFFIISGYLITNILISAKGKPDFFRRFYWRRFLRIVPLYYLVLGVAFFLVPRLHSPHLSKLHDTLAWPYWTFLSNFYIAGQGAFKNGLVDLSWSLSVEEQFYVFWSLSVYFLSPARLKTLALAIVFVSPFLRYLLVDAGVNYIALHVLSFTRMDTLMTGALLALYGRERTLSPKVFLAGFAAFALLTPLIVIPLPTKFAICVYYTLLSGAYGCLVGLVVSASQSGELPWQRLTRFFEWKPLVHVGLYSYGIYLFHNPLQKALQVLLVHRPGFEWLSSIGGQLSFYLLAIGASALLGGLSYHFYETRWLLLKDRLR